MRISIQNRLCAMACALLLPLIASCVGADFTPDYFGITQNNEEKPIPAVIQKPETAETQQLELFKLVVGFDGRQIDVPIPSGNILETGSGTFIARDETDIGPKFSSIAKFKIVNSGNIPVKVAIPFQQGPFFFSSSGKLDLTLNTKQFMIVTVNFTPSSDLVSSPGEVTEDVTIGEETFHVTGIAMDQSGKISANIIDRSGGLQMLDAGTITFDEIPLAAHPVMEYFECQQISCNGTFMSTACVPCTNVESGKCQLLQVNKGGEPVDEVDNDCKIVATDRIPHEEMNLSSTDIITTKVGKRIIELINTGTEAAVINSIEILDTDGSASKGQFSLNNNSVFIADSFEEVKKKITDAFERNVVPESAVFPVTLPPYDPPTSRTKVYLVVAYHPNDILGSNGDAAMVGKSAKDEAKLKITYDNTSREISLSGSTTIKQIPALQVYVRSSSGVKSISNGQTLSLKGITTETIDLSSPLFMKLSESSSSGLRISGIELTGNNFEWLDTNEKINAKPEGSRCTIPVFDPTGSTVDIIEDLQPVSVTSGGFKLESGAYTTDSMPLFGCINFHRDLAVAIESTIFNAEMKITADELSLNGQPALNADGSVKKTIFNFAVLGVIDPIMGNMIFRLTQTSAGLMVPQFPTISSTASLDEWNIAIEDGLSSRYAETIHMLPLILDPFDEQNIYDPKGALISTPNDGITAVFPSVDTRGVPSLFEEPYLIDYTNLSYDGALPEGSKGIFEKYPNVPENYKSQGMKFYTSSLSYPGPLVDFKDRPYSRAECEDVDPCTPEGQRRFGEGPSNPKYKGVCAYFYVSVGDMSSPAFHYPSEEPAGNRRGMCTDRERPYELKAGTGHYDLSGRLELENLGLLFQGPTYFHNPSGPLGPVSPLDERLNVTFTTEMLLPVVETGSVDRIPDKRIDTAKGEYKINLNDPYSDIPKLCDTNTKNRDLRGEKYSTWAYISGMLWKDKERTIPAGCPESNNNFTGGVAYLAGTRVDQRTGNVGFVSVSKFSSSDELTFAFKDATIFVIFRGWICDPNGSEDEFEGVRCYDYDFNARDGDSQNSILNGGER